MEVKHYLPKFSEQKNSSRKVSAEMELFQKLYNEKSANMSQVKVLNFYGNPGTGKTWLLRNIYNMKKSSRPITGNTQIAPVSDGSDPSVAIYCSIYGSGTVTGQIIRQASQKYGFTFPLTSLCLYILSQTDEEEAGVSFPLSELRKTADLLKTEPELQYLNTVLHMSPADKSTYNLLRNTLLFDDHAPTSLRQLAESNAGLLESLFAWPIKKSRQEHLIAFFHSYLAADMERNLKEHRLPAVILLDGIDNFLDNTATAEEYNNREKWLCGVTGLFTAIPHVFWVLTSHKKLNWEKDYLPDWKGSLTQKAITAAKFSKPGRLNPPEKFNAVIWQQQKDALNEKIQCVLEGLGIFNFDMALNACTTLIEEFRDIPGFETECRNHIQGFVRGQIQSRRSRNNYFCYVPENVSENNKKTYFKFKTFYFSLQYYNRLINQYRIGRPEVDEDGDIPDLDYWLEENWEKKFNHQVLTIESLIDKTKEFVNEKSFVQQKLRDFYLTAIIPQILEWIDLGLFSIAEQTLKELQTVTANQENIFSGIYELGYAYLLKVRDNNKTEAVKRIEHIYQENLELSGEKSPSSIYLLNILGYVRSYLPGQELKAYRERRKCASILKETLGKKAIQTIRAICLIAPHLSENGRIDAAKALSHICYRQSTRLYGKNSLVATNCASQYAFRLEEKEQYHESLILHETAAKNYEEIYGIYDRNTLTELESLADVLYSLSRNEYDDDDEDEVTMQQETKEKELRIREDLLNHYLEILQVEKQPNSTNIHPLVREAVVNVCYSLQNCGRYEESIQFAIKHLGEDNPDTIATLNNAAIYYYNDDKNDQAMKTAQQALELCKKQGFDTYEILKQYIISRVSLSTFLLGNGSSTKEESLASCKSIIKDCETLMEKAEKEEKITESKLFTAKRYYNIAQIVNYNDENDFALEIIEKAIDLKKSASTVQDEDLTKYLNLKERIIGEME